MSIKYNFFGKDLKINLNQENYYQDLKSKITKLGFKTSYSPIFVKQAHSNKVHILDSRDIKINLNDKSHKEADAIVTNIPNLAICILTADCVPIILIDKFSNIIAITHAGWRGAKSGIIENSVKAMIDIGSSIKDVKAIIGPCIRQESYEVDRSFYKSFLSDNRENKSYFVSSLKINHFMFNLPLYCINKLEKLGIREIEDKKIDTYKSKKDFFSYRQRKSINERNISVVTS